jgi:hypothetical protein
VPEPVAIPPAIREYLVQLIGMRFGERDPRPALQALPAAMPAGEVRHLATGGAFGWVIEARLDEIDGRLALECLEDSRMAGPEHYRVWEDGTREPLASEHTGYSHAAGAPPDEIERVKAAYYAHNGAVQEQLRERGFGPR